MPILDWVQFSEFVVRSSLKINLNPFPLPHPFPHLFLFLHRSCPSSLPIHFSNFSCHSLITPLPLAFSSPAISYFPVSPSPTSCPIPFHYPPSLILPSPVHPTYSLLPFSFSSCPTIPIPFPFNHL